MSKDGHGYIYALTDGNEAAPKVLVKVGCSRDPYKKAEQAQRFNPKIDIATTVTVSQRAACLAATHAALAEHRYKPHELDDWFEGPLESILETILNIAEHYPDLRSASDSEVP